MSSKNDNKHDRRHFLRGTAGAALLLPHLPSLSRRAEAQALKRKKRLIVVYSAQHESELILPQHDPATGALLSLQGSYMEPLAPLLRKILYVTNTAGGYDHAAHWEALTGYYRAPNTAEAPPQGPSIDRYIAGRLGPGATPLPSLELTADRYSTNKSTLSWTEGALPVRPIFDPLRAFERVFGAIGGAGLAGAGDDLLYRRALKKSLLDALIGESSRLAKSLSVSDRKLMDEHLTLLREMEQRLAQQQLAPPVKCEAGTPPASLKDSYVPLSKKPQRTRDMMDIILRVIACDATRIVTLSMAEGGTSDPCNFLPGVTSSFHEVSHGNAGRAPNFKAEHFATRKWEAEQLAYLVNGLDAMSDPSGGTMLDNSLVLRISELGTWSWERLNKNDSNDVGYGGHSRARTTSIIIGGCGGYFKTGRLVDVRALRTANEPIHPNNSVKGAASQHNLLLTIGHAFGYDDLKTFGQYGTSALAELRA